ncbi:MAG: hypothetical protein E7414_00410 [Ruminococcaceae bacterium]|nr:hypothetical protein [Oscillospiraceae bacterium]
MKRVNALPKVFLRFIQADARLYIYILLAFIIGGIFAALFAFGLPESALTELSLYVDDFFQNMHKSGTDSVLLFQDGLVMHIKSFGILLLLSVMVIGAPFIAVFAGLKGFMQGFTLFFMFRVYSFRAVLFFLAGMLPHGLILLPCYSVLFVTCLKFSKSLVRDRQNLKARLLHFALILGILFLVAVMATLIQAYVEPLFIRLIAGMYTA